MNPENRHIYEYEVDLTEQTAAVHVMHLVGQSKRVLEVGCGPGSITKILAQEGQCRVTGLELDLEAIKKVTPYCDIVMQADLNSPEWPRLLDGMERFDVVVAADVLEHLYDPWATLKRMAFFINPNGYLVVSLPHAGHAAMVSCLVNSDFEYRDWGLLDRTHIRFFGFKNIEKLFAQADLKIIDARYVIKFPDETELAASWSGISFPMRDLIMNTPHSRVYQVVVKAVPLNHPAKAISLVAPETQYNKQSSAPIENTLRSMAGTNKDALTQISNNPQSLGGDAHNTATQPQEGCINPRLIAFYLPQFHPTPENDLWWGKGFTEWTNVTKAEPLFEGHLQPHLPTDFGFYDLRVREIRRDQIRVAKQYGIDGFCYHYYWFSGKRILSLPLDDMLADPESDMPFCLCWANENWTRRWDGADQEILIAQQYLPDDDLNFIKSVVPFFQDRRYIRVDGKLYLIVYRPQHLPNARKTVGVWRDYCRSIGLGELYLCAALTHGNEDYAKFGFDSGVEFPPHNLKIADINDQVEFYETFIGRLIQFASIAQSHLDKVYDNPRVFRTVFPSWDNTARTKERALVVLNGTPENYEYWLASTIDQVKQTGDANELVFINAWNEWAEGCHLEPDRWFGHGFLQATLNAKTGVRRFSTFPHFSASHHSRITSITIGAHLTNLNQALIERDNEIANLNQALTERDNEISNISHARSEISAQLIAIENSTLWKMTFPLRRTLTHAPALRKIGRRTVKLVWWTSTFQLGKKLHKWKTTDTDITHPEAPHFAQPTKALSKQTKRLESKFLMHSVWFNGLLRRIYRILPVPQHFKQRLKEIYFSRSSARTRVAKSAFQADSEHETLPLLVASARQFDPADPWVLVADLRLPTPDQDSGSVRMSAILRLLKEMRFRVTFISDSETHLPDYQKFLEKEGIEVLQGFGAACSHLRTEGGKYHFVLLSRPEVAFRYLAYARGCALYSTIIYDTVDLHWVRFEREMQISGDRSLINRINEFRRIELFNAACADQVLAITNEERDCLLAAQPDAKITVLPNIHEIFPPRTPFAQRRGLLFIGGFWHKPNEDAVIFFVRNILPLIIERIPGLVFYMIGSNMPASVKSLHSANVEPLGFVPDVAPYFESCRIFVAPLRFGAGMKGKVGQSMSHGLPVITTRIGAEGMGLEHEKHLLVADNEMDFANWVVRLYNDEILWHKLANASLSHVEANYSLAAARKRMGRIFSRTQNESSLKGHQKSAINTIATSAVDIPAGSTAAAREAAV